MAPWDLMQEGKQSSHSCLCACRRWLLRASCQQQPPSPRSGIDEEQGGLVQRGLQWCDGGGDIAGGSEMWFWRPREPAWLWEQGLRQPFPISSKSQQAFRTGPCESTAGGREKKSRRRGLNPSQSLFGKLLVDKNLLIFLGRTPGLVFTACHRRLALGRRQPGAARLQSGQQSGRCHAVPTPGYPLGHAKRKRGEVSCSLHPTPSWPRLPGSAERGLTGQFGDRNASLLGRDGAQPLVCWAKPAELLPGCATLCLMVVLAAWRCHALLPSAVPAW